VALSDLQVQTLAREAMQRASTGDFASAERLLMQLVEARPQSGQALHLLGQARLKLGRFADARAPLERAAMLLPREASAQVNLAGCLAALGEHEAALAALDRAALLKPDDAAIAHNRGRALQGLGRLEEADRAYDTALAIDHRLMPSLVARADLLAARGEWAGALADLDMALTNRPDNAALKLKRGELLLGQGDWLRGLADYEARLDVPDPQRYAPALPRWQGEPLSGRLLVYPEQADIEGDAARRDTLMLARGIDATVECGETLARWLDGPTIRRGAPLDGFAAAAPLRSLPYLLNWDLHQLPPPLKLRARPDVRPAIGWFIAQSPPAGVEVERDPAGAGSCTLVVGGDSWPVHLAAALGVPTVMILPAKAHWLWGPRRGPSPWYATLDLLAEDDTIDLEGGGLEAGLAARLAGRLDAATS